MADAAATRAAGTAAHGILLALQTLGLTAWPYPSDTTLTNSSSYDYIILGGGTAGSVLANRLSADCNTTVLVIEAGGYAPLESDLPGTFPYTANTYYDFNFTTVDDNTTMQHLIGNSFSLLQAKVLGGCSSTNHLSYNRGDAKDFKEWADMTNDSAWNITNLLPYYKKVEATIPIKQYPRPEAMNFLKSLWELDSSTIKTSDTELFALGYDQPLFTIDNGVRQSNALAYLSPVKDRTNLKLSLSSTATKILIENNVAIGVQVTKGDATYLIYANKEVIVSAGVVNSPKLLMLSGIGPQSHLESLGIEVIADLPVGQNFRDQTGVPILLQTEYSTVVSGAANPHEYPAYAVTGSKELDSSSYQLISLGFEANATGLLALSSLLLRYDDDISQKLFEGTINRRSWLSLLALNLPYSSGNVSLASVDPAVDPIIYSGAYSNSSDSDLMLNAIMEFIQVLNTTYFKSANATILDLGLCDGTIYDEDYWKCYLYAMSTTIWHSGGTCAIGSVLDSNMRVKGVSSLRVVDSSAMPTLTKGGTSSTVSMLAELASELILGKATFS